LEVLEKPMIHGTQDEYLYHRTRGEDELRLANHSEDDARRLSHKELADRHLARSAFIARVIEKQIGREPAPIIRCAKES
jgi:hypothetical protein